jgi:hypothetical protein
VQVRLSSHVSDGADMSFTLTPTGVAAPSLQTPRDSVYVLKKRTAVRDTIGLQQGFIGSTVTLNSTLSVAATVTATLSMAVAVAATASGVATTSGSIHKDWTLDGSVDGNSTVTGLIPIDMSGDSVGSTTVQGELLLGGSIEVAATVDATADNVGDLSVHTLSASISGETGATAELSQEIPQTGSGSGTATVTAVVDINIGLHSGTLSGLTTTTADLSREVALNSTVTGTSIASGYFAIYELEATLAGVTTLTIQMLKEAQVHAGTLSGTSTVSGNIHREVAALNSTVAGISTASGYFAIYELEATPSGSTTLDIALFKTLNFVASTLSCAATVTANIHREVAALNATSAGTTTVTGNYQSLIFANVDGYGTVDAELRRLWSLEGTCTGDGEVEGEADVHIFASHVDGEADVSSTISATTGLFATAIGSSSTSVTVLFRTRGSVGHPVGSSTVAGYTSEKVILTPVNNAVGQAVVYALLRVGMGAQIYGTCHTVANVTKVYGPLSASPAGFATIPRIPPGDIYFKSGLEGKVTTYSGVGQWHSGATFNTGLVLAGAGVRTNTERINIGVWDGTSDPITTPLLNLETGATQNVTLPGIFRRRLQLADPGTLGGWFTEWKHSVGLTVELDEDSGAEAIILLADLFIELYGALHTPGVAGNATVAGDLYHIMHKSQGFTGNVASEVDYVNVVTGGVSKGTPRPPLSRWDRHQMERVMVLQHHYV